LLYHQQVMKNEFINRIYNDGETIRQQFLENRTQPIYNFKTGFDWHPNESNTFTFSGLFNYRSYNDLGDLMYLNSLTGERIRLWLYDELEVNQTIFATISHKYSFQQPGHVLASSFNYSFRRKDEKFRFENYQPGIVGTDTTMLIADENIFDLTVDYDLPLKAGRLEMGTKQRARIFPNLITFTPGISSILDPNLDGTAEYREWLSAVYGNYIYEKRKLELEAGLRVEYVSVDYLVDPNHAIYESDGFNYFEPFPSVRASFYVSPLSNFSVFYNRRVDRPEERNLRVFPTYADPEILMIGNPTLIPQFTNTVELGYKR
jgi:outer membrane receptor protein involved in Fe transport